LGIIENFKLHPAEYQLQKQTLWSFSSWQITNKA